METTPISLFASRWRSWAQGKLARRLARGNAGGDSIAIKDVQPGDILQFRDYEVTTTTVTKYQFEDGASETVTIDDVAERGHHTAVVNGTLDSNGVVKTLDQHVKPLGKVVQNKNLNTRDVPAVTRNSNTKRKHPQTKKLESAKVRTTVTITISGQVWAYRPKAKP